MAKRTGVASSTQVGAVGEAIVAAQLLMGSHGRLMPFLPMADDDGIDLLLSDRKTGVIWPIQVKSRTKTLAKSPKVVHFQVRKATFKKQPNAQLLGVLLGSADGELGIRRAWLVPMVDLPKIGTQTQSDYRIRPSVSMTSKDRYTPYRCEDIAEVVRRLLKGMK